MFKIDHRSTTPIYEQIILEIKSAILQQVYLPNEKIPSVREYSSLIGVNPNTVSKAYQELERQKVIVTIKGRGTFVAEEPIEESSMEDVLALKERFIHILIDSHYLGITNDQLKAWYQEHQTQIKGSDSSGN